MTALAPIGSSAFVCTHSLIVFGAKNMIFHAVLKALFHPNVGLNGHRSKKGSGKNHVGNKPGPSFDRRNSEQMLSSERVNCIGETKDLYTQIVYRRAVGQTNEHGPVLFSSLKVR